MLVGAGKKVDSRWGKNYKKNLWRFEIQQGHFFLGRKKMPESEWKKRKGDDSIFSFVHLIMMRILQEGCKKSFENFHFIVWNLAKLIGEQKDIERHQACNEQKLLLSNYHSELLFVVRQLSPAGSVHKWSHIHDQRDLRLCPNSWQTESDQLPSFYSTCKSIQIPHFNLLTETSSIIQAWVGKWNPILR